MSKKYDFAFKLKIVKEYLEGSLGYRVLARKYGLPSPTSLEYWVSNYKAYGEAGLSERRPPKHYDPLFKLKVVHYKEASGLSYRRLALLFNTSPTTIAFWQKRYRQEGIFVFFDEYKERMEMEKDLTKDSPLSKEDDKTSREKALERENELLRLEVAYLKKLRAFREQERHALEKSKANWLIASKKKDSC